MNELKPECEEIVLHGYRIQLFEDKIKIYNHHNTELSEFKETSDKLVRYLMDEMFVERKKIKIEVATLDL